ncbi:hypothetical protein ACE14D_06330 [Streptomyces sp. Act-28]
MTASLHFAEGREAAGTAAFLARLLRYDRAAAVRLQAGGGALAVFGRPPSFEVLAVRTAALLGDTVLDTTVSAGELLDGVDEAAGRAIVPAPVTGPPWSGVLPPRGGWRVGVGGGGGGGGGAPRGRGGGGGPPRGGGGGGGVRAPGAVGPSGPASARQRRPDDLAAARGVLDVAGAAGLAGDLADQ